MKTETIEVHLTVNSDQDAFNEVCRLFRTQPRQAVDDAGDCRYRGEHGTKCAIGVLIPDEFYRPWIEGTDGEELVCEQVEIETADTAYVWRVVNLSIDPTLLGWLQATHDQDRHWSSAGFDGWDQMRRIAEMYGLDPAEAQP